MISLTPSQNILALKLQTTAINIRSRRIHNLKLRNLFKIPFESPADVEKEIWNIQAQVSTCAAWRELYSLTSGIVKHVWIQT